MVKETALYDVLGVAPTASEADIKRGFLLMSRKWHPDKNPGNPEAEAMMKRVTAAYDVLKDPAKRERYDRFGMEGLQGPGDSEGGSIFDILGGIFGGGGRGGGSGSRSPPRKGDSIGIHFDITLEEAYTGIARTVTIPRKERCGTCHGAGGSREDAVQQCTTCGGRGVVMQVRRMGQVIQQTQTYCPDCGGKGELIDPKYVCKGCMGKKAMVVQKPFTVELPPGSRNDDRITFYGDGHWEPGCAENGDLVFVVRVKPHERFTRRGADLVTKRTITLAEALCGFTLRMVTLDKRHITIVVRTGDIVKPGEFMCVEGEGMPVYGEVWRKGNLFIEFDVTFPTPESMDDAARVHLMQAFKPSKAIGTRINEAKTIEIPSPAGEQVYAMTHEGPDDKPTEAGGSGPGGRRDGPRAGGGGGSRGAAYDDDDDDDHGGQQTVGCGVQ